MIKLSDRLQIIADRLEGCETMADIGSDHGFLPVYMVESGRCRHAIAADISQPSLAKACQLVAERGVENCDLRVGDGLAVIGPGEVDGVVIAGMGGTLISEILQAHMDVARSLKVLVLQPRTAMGELRRWLMNNDFAIIAEDTVHEGKFIPEIITAKPKQLADFDLAAGGAAGEDDLYYEVPAWIVNGSGPVKEHIQRVLNRERTVLDGLMSARAKDENRIQEKRRGIDYLEALCESMEE